MPESEVNKLPVRLPFTNYDFFGYLIPGITFLSGIILYERWCRNHVAKDLVAPLYTFFLNITGYEPASGSAAVAGFSARPEPSAAVTIGLFLLFAIIGYVVGHIISSVSSLTLERALVGKGYGWPYETLFDMRDPARPEGNKYGSAFYRGLFFWLTVYLILRYVDACMLHGALQRWARVVSVVIAVVWGSRVVLGAFHGALRKRAMTSGRRWSRLRDKVGKAYLIAWAGPYDMLARILARYQGTRASFPPFFRELYRKEFEQLFGVKPEIAGTENFWWCAAYVALRSPRLNARLVNWLDLYGFARNLACAFYSMFIYMFGFVYLQRTHFAWPNHALALAVPLLALGSAVIMAVRYYYLYFAYFSKFTYRSFLILRLERERGSDLA